MYSIRNSVLFQITFFFNTSMLNFYKFKMTKKQPT